MVLANFGLEEEGTDGCSAGFEFSIEKQKKFSRDFTLRQVEPEDLEQLIAEIAELEEDEVEERVAAAAAMDVGEGTTTTTTTTGDAQIANANNFANGRNITYALNSALKGARAGQDLSPPINNNVTLSIFSSVFNSGVSRTHRNESSYRPNSEYDRLREF